MEKKSPLYQLVGLRMNSIMNELQNEAYQPLTEELTYAQTSQIS